MTGRGSCLLCHCQVLPSWFWGHLDAPTVIARYFWVVLAVRMTVVRSFYK